MTGSGGRERRFSLGLDYGTNSVRALIVDVDSGGEIASSVFHYPGGEDGVLLDPKDPNLARQAPADYIEGFRQSVRAVLAKARRAKGFDPSRIVGIGVDATGSTPIPLARDGTPLAMTNRFRREKAAQAWLWKDHTSHAEAAEITDAVRKSGAPYLDRCGGTYSSEWFWAKILHCRRTSPDVFEAAFSWAELSDFVPAWLTGNRDPLTMARNICAAGHKAMYSDVWGGLPPADFLAGLDPALAGLRDRLYAKALTADRQAGRLSAGAAKGSGLPEGIPVAVGLLDAHAGAVGAGIRPGRLVKILGTSSCDMLVAPADSVPPDIPGICGIVPGSIVPGMYGIEAGQSAVGDIFNWFVSRLCPKEYSKGDPHANLSREAAKLKPGESGLIALDWNNGNRCVLADPLLSGLMMGQALSTSAPEIYRTLIEATAMGARVIIERLEEYGVRTGEVVCCGGIAEKNPLVMTIYADVLNRPIRTARSSQTCALGAAIFGAVAGGAYRSVEEASEKMTGPGRRGYRPDPRRASVYDRLYSIYR
ncbi:MAG: ribulokinase, partial [Planctomycetota bacterium]|nr:ribulokinase [Planctomycetota bacterium]